MPMTIVITRDVEDRYRGFLASLMLEIAPGVYTAPHLSAGVRKRIWEIISSWYDHLGRGMILMAWEDASAIGGQSVEILGETRRDLVDVDGFLLVRKELLNP